MSEFTFKNLINVIEYYLLLNSLYVLILHHFRYMLVYATSGINFPFCFIIFYLFSSSSYTISILSTCLSLLWSYILLLNFVLYIVFTDLMRLLLFFLCFLNISVFFCFLYSEVSFSCPFWLNALLYKYYFHFSEFVLFFLLLLISSFHRCMTAKQVIPSLSGLFCVQNVLYILSIISGARKTN